MKSSVCKIEQGSQDLAAILKESERVAAYMGLTHKQTLQLRLLCEEMDGMLPHIIDDFEGNIWFEYEANVCKIKVSIEIPAFNTGKKAELIDLAKNKKNVAAMGLVGKIRNAIENFFLSEETIWALSVSSGTFHLATGYSEGVDYTYLWSLEGYRNAMAKEEQPEEWDELEKSVIASVADDVVVGVKGSRADIVIVKKFA